MNGTVVIAGAGPTGLMLAGELRRGGVETIVLDPRPGTGESSRGMAVHGRTVEALHLRGLADELREMGMFPWPRTPFAFLWLDVDEAAPTDLTYGMPQWRTEGLLERHAAEAGVNIRRGHELVGFEQDAGGVTVTTRSAAGEETIRAAYLVGCDGPESTVRRLAGISQQDHSASAYYGVLGDVEVEDDAFDAGLHPAGVFGAIPIGPGLLRFMTIEFERDPVPADTPVTEEELTASIERITGSAPRVRATRYLARYGQQSTMADSFRAGRVFLAGDAAHVYFVSGTQGMNGGIQDAMNLGWKLAADLAGWAPEGLLDTYHEERSAAAARAVTHARAQMALMHPLAKVEPLRGLFGELLRYESVNDLLLKMPTDARYPAPEPGAHPLTGRRLADVPLVTADGTLSLAQTLHAARGVLLDLRDADGTALPLTGWQDRIDVVRAKPVAEIDAAVVLLRPDGHVAYAGDSGSEAAAAAHRWFGAPSA